MLGGTGTYEPCKRYGATVDSWAISQNHGGFLVYGDDGENEGVVIGRIIGDHCKARFITFQYELGGDNTTATPASYHDGQDPLPCGTPEIEYPLGEPCTDGSLVVAFFDPNIGKYQAIATKNGILGDPVTRDLLIEELTADGCNIGFTKQSAKIITCDADPEAGSISLGSETVTVVSSITDSGSGPIVIEYTDVYVCGFGGVFESEIATTTCPTVCSGSCVWTWNVVSPSAGNWELTTPCAEGCDCGAEPDEPTEFLPYDIEGEPITESVPCVTASP
jgi:hypothetical protein